MAEPNLLDSVIKRRMRVFLFLGVSCAVALGAALLLRNYAESLRLPRVKADSRAMQVTVHNMETTLKRFREMLPLQLTTRSGEARVYALLDTLRTRYRNADIKVEVLQERSDELVLPVQITFRAMSYVSLVQEVGYLQSLRFPFFEITGMALRGGESAGFVACSLSGAIHIFNSPVQSKK